MDHSDSDPRATENNKVMSGTCKDIHNKTHTAKQNKQTGDKV